MSSARLPNLGKTLFSHLYKGITVPTAQDSRLAGAKCSVTVSNGYSSQSLQTFLSHLWKSCASDSLSFLSWELSLHLLAGLWKHLTSFSVMSLFSWLQLFPIYFFFFKEWRGHGVWAITDNQSQTATSTVPSAPPGEKPEAPGHPHRLSKRQEQVNARGDAGTTADGAMSPLQVGRAALHQLCATGVWRRGLSAV